MGTGPVQQSSLVLLSAQDALIKQLEAKASNLANASTAGFQSLLLTTKEISQKTPDTNSISYVKQATLQRDTSQGPVHQTGNIFDIAIMGKGYFKVNGDRYTRNGRFQIDQTGKLITIRGDAVMNSSGSEIYMPQNAKNIQISEDGTIVADKEVIGQLGVFKIDNEQDMIYQGYGLFSTTQEAPLSKEYRLNQGAYEESNVQIFKELAELVEIQRRYEQTQSLGESEEERKKKFINLSERN